jgi:hypothetical protein
MRLLNKNSKRFIVNLFSDFILSKIDKTEKTIIQVSDCNNFVVVAGKSTSKEMLDLQSIKEEFFIKFKSYLDDVGIDHMNIIDIITYGSILEPLDRGWVNVSKDVYYDAPEPLTNIITTSEFPYGHSLSCGRSMVYYSNYIFNHMYSLLGVKNLKFYFTTDVDSDEDFKIEIVSESILISNEIKSLVLDVFDFDLNEFNNKLSNYDLIDDILYQDNNKPYMVQDRLEHVVLI